MTAEDRRRLDRFEGKLDAMCDRFSELWIALKGSNGRGLLQRWERFEDEVLPDLMTKSDCGALRKQDDELAAAGRQEKWKRSALVIARWSAVFAAFKAIDLVGGWIGEVLPKVFGG